MSQFGDNIDNGGAQDNLEQNTLISDGTNDPPDTYQTFKAKYKVYICLD